MNPDVHDISTLNRKPPQNTVSRRLFLKTSATFFASTSLSFISSSCTRRFSHPHNNHLAGIRFGLLADSHYADVPPRGSRHYRDSLAKLTACIDRLNTEQLDFLIELGDFKDQDTPPDPARTLVYLEKIEIAFRRFNGPAYHVLGNHDLDSISKTQFLSRIQNTGIPADRSYYSFDINHLHIVVLDANFRADGLPYDRGNYHWTDTVLPPAQLEWLRRDLADAARPTLVFIHQCLDGTGDHYVKNAPAVRAVLEQSGAVLAVFQGHLHTGNLQTINGLPYYTLKAMIEGPYPEHNAFAVAEIHPDKTIALTGYGSISNQVLSNTRTIPLFPAH